MIEFYISHRGNLEGPDEANENSPSYIINAINQGFDVEIDVWFENKKFFLGHDKPSYLIDINFLKNNKLWCHAKNHQSLKEMIKNNIHCFWHQDDDITLTSNNFIWSYPKKCLLKERIEVVLEKNIPAGFNGKGICSDYIKVIKDNR